MTLQIDQLTILEFTVKFNQSGQTVSAIVEVKGNQIPIQFALAAIGSEECTIRNIKNEIRIRADERWKMMQQAKAPEEIEKVFKERGYVEL